MELGISSLKRKLFVEEGNEKVNQLLKIGNEIVAYDFMKKEILPLKPEDVNLTTVYLNWIKRIALMSKHESVRHLAIEELYKNEDVNALELIISETEHEKDRRVCVNLILESCKENVSSSPLDSLAHKMGIGTAGIRVVGKDWIEHLPTLVRTIRDYELRKEVASKVHNITKQKMRFIS